MGYFAPLAVCSAALAVKSFNHKVHKGLAKHAKMFLVCPLAFHHTTADVVSTYADEIDLRSTNPQVRFLLALTTTPCLAALGLRLESARLFASPAAGT